MMIRNFVVPAIIEQDSRVIGLVKTCSECSMQMINGKININGILHRTFYTDDFGYLDCRKCPVHLHSVKIGEFHKILMILDGEK